MHIRESRLSNMDLKITAIMCVRGRDRGTFWYRSRDYSNHMGEGTWQRDFLVDLKITAIMWASGRDKLTFWYRFGIQQPCGWGDVGLSRHSYDCVLQCVAVRCVLRPCHILAPALVRLLGQECDMVLVHNTLQHTATHLAWCIPHSFVIHWFWVRGCLHDYGVATISRLLKIIGLFCKRAL